MGKSPQTVTRRELYDLVWTVPGRTLAQRFGISDVGLAKVCRKHEIPRPPRGYWARVQHGQKPKREPLPKGKHGPEHVITFAERPLHPSRPGSDVKHEPQPFEFFDEGLRALSERISSGELVSPVKDSLRGCHEVVSRTRRWLIASRRRPRWDDYGARHSARSNDDDRLAHVTIAVGREHEPRALRVLDAVIRTLEAAGATVEQPDRRDHRRDVLFAHGHWRFELRIRERHKRVRRVLSPAEMAKKREGRYWGPTYESAVNDCLFEVEDGVARKLEDSIEGFAQRVLRAADERLRRQAEERQRQLLAIERHKKEQAEAERRRVERARHDAEMERRAWLVQLLDWRDNAQRIDRFLDEFEASLDAPEIAPGIAPEVRAGLERWIAWGRRVARDTDPMRWKPTSLIEHTHAESGAAVGQKVGII